MVTINTFCRLQIVSPLMKDMTMPVLDVLSVRISINGITWELFSKRTLKIGVTLLSGQEAL
jgi:hypothetical protein